MALTSPQSQNSHSGVGWC